MEGVWAAMGVEVSPEGEVWDAIRAVVAARDPRGFVVPSLTPGFTDAKYFSRLGARWLGFVLVKLEAAHGVSFSSLFHATDERIPVDGFLWGTDCLLDLVCRLCLGVTHP